MKYKKLIIATIIIMFMSIPCLATDFTWSKWDRTDKVLFTTFTLANVVDMIQTNEIYDNPRFREANPLLSRNTYIPILLVVNIAAIPVLNSFTPKVRRGMLWWMNVVKIGVVGHNYSIGVRMGF